MTLANGDETGFARASTQAVAGRLSRERTDPARRERQPIRLRCWPGGTPTSDLPSGELAREAGEEIIVTASRIPRPELAMVAPPPPAPAPVMMTTQEELGDLKLYRIPEPVTVSARGQKQVGLFDRPRASVREVYRRSIYIGAQSDPAPLPAIRTFVTRNRPEDGLGLPLPAGRVALFARARGRPVLVGQGAMGDHAIGEEVVIEAGTAPGVRSQLVQGPGGASAGSYVPTVTNDRPAPVPFEADFQGEVVGSRPTRP